MPLYKSKCSSCGHEVEDFCSMKDGIKKECPECGTPTMQKVFEGWNGVHIPTGYMFNDVRAHRGRKRTEPNRETPPGLDT